jgi:hypothetical protein
MSNALQMLLDYQQRPTPPQSKPQGDWALLDPDTRHEVRRMTDRHQRRFWLEMVSTEGSLMWTGTTWRRPTIEEAAESALVKTRAAIRAEEFARRWPEKRR